MDGCRSYAALLAAVYPEIKASARGAVKPFTHHPVYFLSDSLERMYSGA
jgi:hypothetical protein